MSRLRQLRCSFCGKGEAEVEKLVAGPRVFICDKCVAIASRMMNEPRGDDDEPTRARQSSWRRVSAAARRYLRGGGARRVADAHGV